MDPPCLQATVKGVANRCYALFRRKMFVPEPEILFRGFLARHPYCGPGSAACIQDFPASNHVPASHEPVANWLTPGAIVPECRAPSSPKGQAKRVPLHRLRFRSYCLRVAARSYSALPATSPPTSEGWWSRRKARGESRTSRGLCRDAGRRTQIRKAPFSCGLLSPFHSLDAASCLEVWSQVRSATA